MAEVKPIEIHVKVDIPAIDKVIGYLERKSAEPAVAVKAEAPVETVAETNVVEMPAPKKKAPAPKKEPVTEPEPEVVEAVPEVVEAAPTCEADEAVAEPQIVEEPIRLYKPDEVAAMAMKLRDKDKSNSAKIKEHFPELGIKSLGDIRSNEEACQKLARILISMGGLG